MKCFGDKSRTHHCKVVLLDEQELIQEIQDTTTGQDLLETVFSHLNLMETAYFGLRYLDPANQTHWLDPAKKVVKQLKGTSPFTLYFSVKFYAADPCKLVEEITRYQFFLQVKQDILQGRLPISQDLAAELGSYAVQSELGDYDPRRHSPGYVSEFRFVTTQSVPLESRIADMHKKLLGQVPSKAEMCYLEKVKWLDMYGVDLHPVLGEDNIEYFLGLTPSGVIVLRNKAKVGNYFWPRISKVYFRGRFFMLRVRDKNNSENTYGFETPSKAACKHLWQCCVEHHAFFRLTQASGNTPAAIFSLGSKFRYSGRTEKEAVHEAKLGSRTQPEFTRMPSRRYQRRIVEGAQDTPRVEDIEVKQETRSIVQLPTPASTGSHMYRSSNSLSLGPRSDSPRSTRSAPQPAGRGRAAGGAASPRSVRSAAATQKASATPAKPSTPAKAATSPADGYVSRRTSSVDSQSSVDSRGHRRRRRGRARSSDGESEASSKCSSRCHRHRHRHSSDDPDNHRHRRRRHRNKSGGGSMVNSEGQWAQVQAGTGGQVRGCTATVRDLSHKSGYQPSGVDTEGDSQHHHHSNKKRHRKHRSRSRSPSEAKNSRLPEELRRHLEFDLQRTQGLSEAQLRQIPYTRVETAKTIKIKYTSPKTKRHKSPRRSKSNSSDRKATPPADGESPPPPYTPSPATTKTNTLPKSVHKDGVGERGGGSNNKGRGGEGGALVNGTLSPSQPREGQTASITSPRIRSPDGRASEPQGPRRSGEGQSSSGRTAGEGQGSYRTHQDEAGHIGLGGPSKTPIPPPVLPSSSQSYSLNHFRSPHKAVMVNGPSVKALVTGGNKGRSTPLSHEPPAPLLDDGENGERGLTQFTAVLKPQSSPQSSVTSGISVGSSSTSTAIASDNVGIPICNFPTNTANRISDNLGIPTHNSYANRSSFPPADNMGNFTLGNRIPTNAPGANTFTSRPGEVGSRLVGHTIGSQNKVYLPSIGLATKTIGSPSVSGDYAHKPKPVDPVNRMTNGYFNGDSGGFHMNGKANGHMKTFGNGHVNSFMNGQLKDYDSSLNDSMESEGKGLRNVTFACDDVPQRNCKNNGINITMNNKIERNSIAGERKEGLVAGKVKKVADEISTEL